MQKQILCTLLYKGGLLRPSGGADTPTCTRKTAAAPNPWFRDSKSKNPAPYGTGFSTSLYMCQELALRDSAYRAGTCTGTAIYTSISVDLVLAIALSDCTYRALASARAAHNAAATDNICHWFAPPNVFYNYYCTTSFEKSNKNRWLVFGNFYHSPQFQ